MNKHELKSLLENISSTLMEDWTPEHPSDEGSNPYPFDSESTRELTRELFPNGDTMRPLTPEELDPFHPPAWWTLGVKVWQWWINFSQRPPDPMELDYHRIPPYWYFDAQGMPRQQPWSLPRNDPGYREEHMHDWGPPSLRPQSNTESNTMNKQDLKSLLEKIYEAMILPSLADKYHNNPSLLNPTLPPSPTDSPPPPPPVVPPMPLDNNGRPLFPSQAIWEEYYRLSQLGEVSLEFQRLRLLIFKWRLHEAERRQREQPQQTGQVWG